MVIAILQNKKTAGAECSAGAQTQYDGATPSGFNDDHHIADAYLLRYAQESSWREDNRRVSNGEQVSRVTGLAMKRSKSVAFTGYWQRHNGE